MVLLRRIKERQYFSRYSYLGGANVEQGMLYRASTSPDGGIKRDLRRE